MNSTKNNNAYVSPECETYALAAEGVLCASGGGSSWYDAPGRGSFDYGVDDTDDFGF